MSEDIAPDLFRALHELDAVKEENRAIQQKLTAAEAARDAVAGEVRARDVALLRAFGPGGGVCLGVHEDGQTEWAQPGDWLANQPIVPTPSAALQRVREEAQREGAEKALEACIVNVDLDALHEEFDAWIDDRMARTRILRRHLTAALFPPAPQGEEKDHA